MTKETTVDTTEKVDVEATEDTEVDPKDAPADKAEDIEEEPEESEDDAEAGKDLDNKIDYDKELGDEEKRGKPDPDRAREAFLDRKKKRDEAGADDEDDEKPLTKKDIANIEARVERKALAGQALTIAQQLAGRHANSDKEAKLIVARWSNRMFPEGTPLIDQMEEVYAGLHRKKLIGERDEAIRGLKGRDGINRNGAGGHRNPADGVEPKISPQDVAALKGAGYSFNSATRRYEKKLTSGDTLVRDPRTKATILVKKAKK